MKLLFITCSVIAILYLGFQTKVWESINPFYSSTALQAKGQADSVNQVNTRSEQGRQGSQVMQGDNAAQIDSDIQIKLLKQQIATLNQKIEHIEAWQLQTKEQNAEYKMTSAKTKQTEGEQNAEVQNVATQNAEAQNTDSFNAAVQDVQDKLGSKAQKRQSQQATLREVTRRMELAALSSLSQ